MTTVESITEVLTRDESLTIPSPVDLAAAAFLARYSNRTFEAYRHDLRTFFQWAADASFEVFDATRGHIELYRATLEERGLAPSTIDRPLDSLRVLPFRPYRRPYRVEPGSVRAPAAHLRQRSQG